MPRKPSTDSEIAARVWSRIDKRSESECWPWKGSIFRFSGYGRVHLPGRNGMNAHRYVWLSLHGQVDAKLEICHTCDNRLCCNPAHLFVGTRKDNALDKVKKGRQARFIGTMNKAAKLNEQDVVSIRSSSEGHQNLARLYGVSEAAIRAVRARSTWRHV